jgi:hypothetical protein
MQLGNSFVRENMENEPPLNIEPRLSPIFTCMAQVSGGYLLRLENKVLENRMIPQRMWLGLVLCGAALQMASAQQEMGTQQMSLGQNQSITAAILQPVAGQPYQAEKVTHSRQILGDGTVITHDTRGLIARDAEGRMREELYQVHSGNMNGKQMEMSLQSATVGDPIAHTMLIWTGAAKIAMQMQLPSLPKLPVMGGVALATPPPGTSIVDLGTPNSPLIAGISASDIHTEDLGKQSIEGVLVTGKRVTTTIPTGEIGNDRPIVVVHEEWRSPELKIVVKTIDTDPRTGEQTMELQGLSRADPDPALFQAPAGYKVQDMADMLKGLGNLGKTKTP